MTALTARHHGQSKSGMPGIHPLEPIGGRWRMTAKEHELPSGLDPRTDRDGSIVTVGRRFPLSEVNRQSFAGAGRLTRILL